MLSSQTAGEACTAIYEYLEPLIKAVDSGENKKFEVLAYTLNNKRKQVSKDYIGSHAMHAEAPEYEPKAIKKSDISLGGFIEKVRKFSVSDALEELKEGQDA